MTLAHGCQAQPEDRRSCRPSRRPAARWRSAAPSGRRPRRAAWPARPGRNRCMTSASSTPEHPADEQPAQREAEGEQRARRHRQPDRAGDRGAGHLRVDRAGASTVHTCGIAASSVRGSTRVPADGHPVGRQHQLGQLPGHDEQDEPGRARSAAAATCRSSTAPDLDRPRDVREVDSDTASEADDGSVTAAFPVGPGHRGSRRQSGRGRVSQHREHRAQHRGHPHLAAAGAQSPHRRVGHLGRGSRRTGPAPSRRSSGRSRTRAGPAPADAAAVQRVGQAGGEPVQTRLGRAVDVVGPAHPGAGHRGEHDRARRSPWPRRIGGQVGEHGDVRDVVGVHDRHGVRRRRARRGAWSPRIPNATTTTSSRPCRRSTSSSIGPVRGRGRRRRTRRGPRRPRPRAISACSSSSSVRAAPGGEHDRRARPPTGGPPPARSRCDRRAPAPSPPRRAA